MNNLGGSQMTDETMDRTPTGITGLDDMLEGGLQKGGVYLLAGDTGGGKTIFSSQYLYVGAVKYEEPGVMISLEERSEDIRKNLTKFGWNFAKLEEYGKIVVAVVDGEFTVKRVRKNEEKLFLLPENPRCKAIEITEATDFQVWGVVTYVIHTP